jgi:succinoglycan biosynthesis protein ExoM
MREGDFHSTAPVRRGGTISTGYTCNSLLRRGAPALKGRRFRHDLGKTGGEDTDFFAAAVRSGARIAFAPDALVTEPVEPERACLSWLVRRRFRSGQSHGLLLAGEAEGRGSRLAALLLAAGKCGVSVAGAAVFALSARRCAFWILRASLHAGVVSRLAGARLVTTYGGDDAARRS